MTDDDMHALVAQTYQGLADVLEPIPADRWNASSLCEGWRVREVVAHVTMPVRYDEAAFMAELQEDGFDFTRLSNRIAARDAELPVAELVANLRADALHQWEPPGGGAHGALNHAVIHSLDITVPLGVPPVASDPALRAVLDGLTQGGVHEHFGTDISGQRLEATDLDWSYGAGTPLVGSAADLALQLCGRTV